MFLLVVDFQDDEGQSNVESLKPVVSYSNGITIKIKTLDILYVMQDIEEEVYAEYPNFAEFWVLALGFFTKVNQEEPTRTGIRNRKLN